MLVCAVGVGCTWKKEKKEVNTFVQIPGTGYTKAGERSIYNNNISS